MKVQTLELVIFRAVSGISDEDFIDKAFTLTPVLAAMPGFIKRDFFKGEDGEWIDAVIWDSYENAKAAAKAVWEVPEAQTFFSVINQETINLRHAAIQTPKR